MVSLLSLSPLEGGTERVRQMATSSEVKPGLSEHPVGSEIMCVYVTERYCNHGERVGEL